MKSTVQEMADALVAPQYRQAVKTLAEALDWLGWEHIDKPVCCGAEVEVNSFLGGAYYAGCKTCGKFAVDITGPRFGNSWVQLPDSEKVDLETDKRWIAGVRSLSDPD